MRPASVQSGEHRSPGTETMDEERARRQSHLEYMRAEVKKRIQEKEKKLEEKQQTLLSMGIVQSMRSEIPGSMAVQKLRKVRKTRELIERLQKEIKVLKMRDAELDERPQTENNIHFLQNFLYFCVPPGDENLTGIPKILQTQSPKENGNQEFLQMNKTRVNTPCYRLQNVRERDQLLQYSCPLNLDPSTANRWLHLSDGNKKVTFGATVSSYPDHPDRFDWWFQVLCKEALCGTHCYWEVEWSGEKVEIGVAYKGISRKGYDYQGLFGRNDKSWSLSCSYSSYTACHNKTKTQITAPSCGRIGVHLDCPNGALSFYSISDRMTLLHRFGIFSTVPLHAGFWVAPNSSVTICSLNPCDH
ncbi:tripartite motif-containing protein 16-like [Erpetoichthys calabaricus]|uniref:tripartite motif-containing protein 16-like n=1 Tax=Erpetoichthys calabaricus TaxID=27687 RepID=UPI0022344AF6|nr:tripartite motif-containing protein 16-like [Erpetoichthys calabaricus]